MPTILISNAKAAGLFQRFTYAATGTFEGVPQEVPGRPGPEQTVVD